MTFDEYQKFARSTAVYPEDCKITYPTLRHIEILSLR